MTESIDWSRPTKRKWKFKFELVPPNKLNDSYGELDNVDISSVSITEGYYTDTRIQGKLTYYGENPHRQAYIRIIATDTVSGYSEELGTFIPTSDDVTMEGSIVKTTLNLESTLYGISQQKLQTAWVNKYGMTIFSNIANILQNKCNMTLAVLGGNDSWKDDVDRHGNDYSASPHDGMLSSSAICDAGSSILELLYGIANATPKNRIDVDGHGRVLVYPYYTPSQRDPTFTITANSENSVVLDGVTRSSNYLERASQVTVHAKQTVNNAEKVFLSTQTATGEMSLAQRGYIVGKYYDVSDMSPFTQAEATRRAKAHLTTAQNENIEWTLTTEYMPIYTGDVGYLEGLNDNYNYGAKKKVFVKSRDIDLATMTQKLTLKLASSNDTDTGDEE
jgi:hypothetical protein